MIPTQITIHHTASGNNTTIEQINEWHKARDFTLSSLNYYVGYHYVIFPDGRKIQTRRDNEIGCHCIPNDGKIGICLVGNFQTQEPTDAQLINLYVLVATIKKDYDIVEVWGHRDCNKTECPGNNLEKYVFRLTGLNWYERLIKKLLMPKSNV